MLFKVTVLEIEAWKVAGLVCSGRRWWEVKPLEQPGNLYARDA